MRLAAAEVGLELHNRIAARTGDTLDPVHEQSLQALGQEGAPEELHRLPVLVAPFAQMDLPQVGAEAARKAGLDF